MRKSIYLIVKEAINNLVKYSCATEAKLEMRQLNHQLLVTIGDNGKGFILNANSQRHGIKNMIVRAEKLKGRFNIESAPGKGTKIDLAVPI